jgi:cell division septum initiation protein DivIVA
LRRSSNTSSPSAAAPSLRDISRRAFKRTLLGYRPADVDEAIAIRDREVEAQWTELVGARARIDELELVATTLSERVVERERELRALKLELVRVHGESDRAVLALGAVADELAAVRGQARGQATRIRMRALRDAAEVSERITELARRPAEARERLLEALGEAIARLGGDVDNEVGGSSSNGRHPGADAEELFQGLVEVEVGPLSDFAQLVGFEDAASGIGATSEISVKRFAKGRATLEMNLRQPVELLRELEERAPFEFRVRDTREDRVVLDLDGE